MRRYLCWFLHLIVCHWPLRAFEGVSGKIFFAMLPYAGEWAYYWSEPLEYRQQLDSQ